MRPGGRSVTVRGTSDPLITSGVTDAGLVLGSAPVPGLTRARGPLPSSHATPVLTEVNSVATCDSRGSFVPRSAGEVTPTGLPLGYTLCLGFDTKTVGLYRDPLQPWFDPWSRCGPPGWLTLLRSALPGYPGRSFRLGPATGLLHPPRRALHQVPVRLREPNGVLHGAYRSRDHQPRRRSWLQVVGGAPVPAVTPARGPSPSSH